MCKTLFISEGPSRHKIEEKYEKIKNQPKLRDAEDREKYLKEAEIYFTTIGLGKITGILAGLDYQSDGVLVMTLRIKKIDRDPVRVLKRWKVYYDPYSRRGMFYYKK